MPLSRRVSSIQSRLTLRLIGVFLLAFVVTGVGIFFESRSDTTEIPTDSLISGLDGIEAAITVDGSGTLGIAAPALASDTAFVLRDADGAEVGRGGSSDAIEAAAVLSSARNFATMPAETSAITWHVNPQTGNITHLAARVLRIGGRTLVLEFAKIETPTQAGLYGLAYELVGEFLPIGIPLAVSLLLALTLSLRTALHPLERLKRLAGEISPQQTGLRLPVDELPAELQAPVGAINRALERLDHGFQAQRDFLADAAHELRTPLAILAAHVDTLPRGSETRSLQDDVERMARLVNQLLLVAQLESLTINQEDTADLSVVAVELAALLAPLAIRSGRSIGVGGADQPMLVHGNRDAIHQALRNLVENALRFTPEGSEVEIDVGTDGSLSVSDHGPGIPQAERELLFRRFWQGGRRQHKGGGAGLGLAIAQRIATTHGGRLEVGDNPNGGARFILTLRPVVAAA